MNDILAFTLAAIAYMAPEHAPDAQLAEAIALAAEERPFVAGDARRTAALLVVTAHAESRFDARAVGDSGRSCGYFGIWVGARRERCALMATDPYGAARMARDLLQESLTVCRAQRPAERLGLYLSGHCDRGLAQSRHRWWWFKRLTRVEVTT